MEAAAAANFGSGVEKDLHLRVREYGRSNVAALHHHCAGCAEIALLADHPLADSRMNRDSRGSLGDVLFANALRYVSVVELHAIAIDLRLKRDLGIPG